MPLKLKCNKTKLLEEEVLPADMVDMETEEVKLNVDNVDNNNNNKEEVAEEEETSHLLLRSNK